MDKKITKHESMGVIEISRVSSGGSILVGSEIEHTSFFTLTIKEAEKIESYGETSFHGFGIPLIQVYLSANQFVDMITRMNHVNSSPCTIRYVNDKERQQPQKEVSRIEIASQWAQERVANRQKIDIESAESILKLCDKLPAKKIQDIKIILDNILNGNRNDMRFYLDQIVSATEKSIQIAKTEVESFVSSTVRALGLKSLRSLEKSLEEGDDK